MGTHMQYEQATSKQTQVQKETRPDNGLESSYVDTTFAICEKWSLKAKQRKYTEQSKSQ